MAEFPSSTGAVKMSSGIEVQMLWATSKLAVVRIHLLLLLLLQAVRNAFYINMPG